ncbi:MAG: DUF1622 domain-containing protein [Thermoanaerobaculia bacterium]
MRARGARANLNLDWGRRTIGLEDQFKEIAGFIALAIEAAAVLVVSYGSLQALAGVVGTAFSRTADEMRGREIWLRFATWILLALEFALAADLVRTAVAPTWDDISKLAVIATIRTMLNYFLAKDIAEFDRAQESGGNPPSG